MKKKKDIFVQWMNDAINYFKIGRWLYLLLCVHDHMYQQIN
jgi:hypothetical protein